MYTKQKLETLLKLDIIRFCIVGGTGFVINLMILVALGHLLRLPVFLAQMIGAEIALFSNFMLHNTWTYKARKTKKSFVRLLVGFHTVTWPAIIGSAIMVSVGVRILHLSKLFALVVSSAIALVWNFLWSKYIIWRDTSPKDVEKITV